MLKLNSIKSLQLTVHFMGLGFLIRLAYLIYFEQLSGDPVKDLTHYLGIGAFNFLLAGLMVTPLIKFLQWIYQKRGERNSFAPKLFRLRRPLGLWCLFWATLHIAVWIVLDLQFDWSLIGSELVKRKYIILGGSAWFLLALLGLTSLPYLMRKMGRYWKKLHATVYLVSILVVFHYFLSLKSAGLFSYIYFIIVFLLLAVRMLNRRRSQNR